MDYMTPPIGLCCNGHNTCQKCRPQMNCCPICRQEFIETRNLAMETIARELQYPCRNRAAGCDEKYPMDLINAHQAVCPRRMYNCMLGGMDKCEWKGRRHEILTHARQDHSAHVWLQDEFSLVYTEFEQSADADLIEALGELFVLHRRYDVEKERLYAMVQYLGPTENATLFKYEFEFVELGELRSVLFRNVVHQDTSDADEVFESGNCLLVLRVLVWCGSFCVTPMGDLHMSRWG
ncbi:E3 ubiquitin-protein ligase SIAH1B [Anabrus simplex]|uniref:E3 ubiquitin-protein ligase SIAH1B n=1 Tax=Anabrus simplex TaxID=316456 RepID=UPI0035A27270